ncbi:unnamed protein product [Ixodes hexagonus]
MEQELEIKQPANPVETASCVSRLFFSWVTPLFSKGYRRTLQVEDLYACPKWERSERKADRLQTEWEREVRKLKTGKTPSLFLALVRAFGFTYCTVALLILVEASGRQSRFRECFKNVMQPVMLGWVVRYFSSPDSMSRTEFYLAASGVSVLGGMHIFTHHPYFFNMQRMGMRMRVACCSLVYRKALRLSQAALSKTAVGQMVNLLSNDVNRFDQSVLFVPYLVAGPLQTAVITWVLWQHLGVSCLAGISFVLLYIPFQGCLGRAFSKLRAKTAVLTDERIRQVNEFVAGMRVIKMYSWETPFANLVDAMRRREVHRIRQTSVLRAVNMGLFFMSSKLVLFLCFVSFALLGNTLTSECVFVSMALFNSLRLAMTLYFPFGVGQGAETLVSIRRLQKFLLLEEQDESSLLNGPKLRPKLHNCAVVLDKATASWNKDVPEPTLQNVCATVKPGELLVVVGPVGCGKTSLLMTILGELRLLSGDVKALGRVAYASQEPWMFTGSVRNNVVFDSAYDADRYRRVIYAAAMERDISLLPYGDRTLVGDKGVSLSGGQKARVNLARALYYDADIYLLDDPLSAVDTAVSKHLFEACIRGYLKDKIVILCTHQLQFLKSASQVLVLREGKALGLGRLDQLQAAGIDLESLLQEAPDATRKASLIEAPEGPPDSPEYGGAPPGSEVLDAGSPGAFYESNMSLAGSYDQVNAEPKVNAGEQPTEVEESRSTGSVQGRVYWGYMRAGAGPVLMPLLLVSSVLAQAIFNGSDFWLTYCMSESGANSTANQMVLVEEGDPDGPWAWWTSWRDSLDPVTYSVSVYALIIGALVVTSMARTVAFFAMCMRASVTLHNRMFRSVIRAPIYFFDTNPIGYPREFTCNANRLATITSLLKKHSSLSFQTALGGNDNCRVSSTNCTTTSDGRGKTLPCRRWSFRSNWNDYFTREKTVARPLLRKQKLTKMRVNRLSSSEIPCGSFIYSAGKESRVYSHAGRSFCRVQGSKRRTPFNTGVFGVCQLDLSLCADLPEPAGRASGGGGHQPLDHHPDAHPVRGDLKATQTVSLWAGARECTMKWAPGAPSRSPVFSHLSTSLYGLTTIRAFQAQRTFERMFDVKQDHHTSAWYMFLCTARWFGITLDSICFAYITVVTMSLALSGDGTRLTPSI